MTGLQNTSLPNAVRILGKYPTVFLSKGLRWLQCGTFGENHSYWKSHIWCLFLGLMNERLSCGKKCVLLLKATFFVQPVFFFKHETSENGETEHLFFLRIFKKTFQGKFTSQRRAKMSNLTSLNLENPWLIVPLILTCWGIFFWSNLKDDPSTNTTASMGSVWPRLAEDRQPWKEARLKAEFPQSHGGGWKMKISFSNCTRATSDGEFKTSSFFIFRGYKNMKAWILSISVCFFPHLF